MEFLLAFASRGVEAKEEPDRSILGVIGGVKLDIAPGADWSCPIGACTCFFETRTLSAVRQTRRLRKCRGRVPVSLSSGKEICGNGTSR